MFHLKPARIHELNYYRCYEQLPNLTNEEDYNLIFFFEDEVYEDGRMVEDVGKYSSTVADLAAIAEEEAEANEEHSGVVAIPLRLQDYTNPCSLI